MALYSRSFRKKGASRPSSLGMEPMSTRSATMGGSTRMATFARDAEFVGTRVFMPSSLVLLVFGFWLVHEGHWSLSEGWLVFGLIVIAISIAIGSGFLGPESGRIAKLIEREGPASREVMRRRARIFLVSRIELVLLVLTVVAMAAKPGS